MNALAIAATRYRSRARALSVMGGGSRSAAASKTAEAAGSSSNTATNRRPGTRVLGHRAFQLAGATVGTTPDLVVRARGMVQASLARPRRRRRVGLGRFQATLEERVHERFRCTPSRCRIREFHERRRARVVARQAAVERVNPARVQLVRAPRGVQKPRLRPPHGVLRIQRTHARAFVCVCVGRIERRISCFFSRFRYERFSSFSHNIRTGYRTRASSATGPR